MYLPLAAVMLLVVLGAHAALGRARLAALLAAPLLVLTLLRNGDYVNGVTIWTGSLARYPDNPRAHVNLGDAYVNAGQMQLGEEQFRLALRLDPDQAEAHNNLGVIESGSGRIAEAAADFRAALRLSPNFDEPRKNLEALEAAHPELK